VRTRNPGANRTTARRWSIAVAAVAAGLVVSFAGTARAATATATVSAAPGLTPTFDGAVWATTYSGGTIFVGGDFANAIVGGRRYPRLRLAAINAQTGALLPWVASADATVRALAADPATGTVYAGGAFATVDGQPRAALATLDPRTGALGAFHHAVTGAVRALAIGTGRVYAAGKLTAVDGQPAGNLVSFATDTGLVDTGFHGYTDDAVDALLAAGTRLYLGGVFRLVDGFTGTPKLAALDPVTGARDPAFHPKTGIRAFGLALGPTAIYAAMGGQGGRVVAFGFDGTPVWTTTADGDVQTVGYLDGVVYYGGHFDNVCATNVNGVQGTCVDGSVPRVKFAAVDAGSGTLLPWDPHGNGVHGVLAMAVNPVLGLVAAGGEFTTLGGLRWPRFAQFGPPVGAAAAPG
jgi:hypothetical protein